MTHMGVGHMNSIQRLLVLLSFLAAGFALLFPPQTVQARSNGEPATAKSEDKEEMTGEEIPLREAATRTYEDTGGAIARGLGKSSEEVLSYYCYALAEKVPIYGQFPPSHKKEKVDLNSSHTRRIMFEGNITYAKSLYAGEEGASYLYVLKGDLARAIEEIKQQL
jgi:hypothetical protein